MKINEPITNPTRTLWWVNRRTKLMDLFFTKRIGESNFFYAKGNQNYANIGLIDNPAYENSQLKYFTTHARAKAYLDTL
jgi:hypothetical protein